MREGLRGFVHGTGTERRPLVGLRMLLERGGMCGSHLTRDCQKLRQNKNLVGTFRFQRANQVHVSSTPSTAS
jgi:hypothetical protein